MNILHLPKVMLARFHNFWFGGSSMATDTPTQDAPVQDTAVTDTTPDSKADGAPVADQPTADAPAAPDAGAPVADPQPAPQPEAPAQPSPAAESSPVVVEVMPDPVETFADLYAASSQAFANSRALKAQKEIELASLQQDLPAAQAARVKASKDASDAIAAVQQQAATMEKTAAEEVTRIQEAITAKEAEIEKAENADVEKAEALVAILNNYITKHSS